ncbi:unnamed protein product [Periconia digitata]|uniref:F-box domain-containing protein n=1 Tax=Periconia digitata TaxID=1303443 RepID=A0A9W4U2Z2_9PLEO|nr:unnamed protein product [Periconia digitata]
MEDSMTIEDQKLNNWLTGGLTPHAPGFELAKYTHTVETHTSLRPKWFYLDRILDKMAPVFTSKPVIIEKELGTLDVLPTEILFIILQHLTVAELAQFRRCNRYSNYLIPGVPSLRAAMHIAPNVFKGLVALEIALHMTPQEMCMKFRQRHCERCRAGYRGEGLAQCIYLPTFQRICFPCLDPNLGTRKIPLPASKLAIEPWFLSPKEVAALPVHRSLPGTFTDGTQKHGVTGRHKMYEVPAHHTLRPLGSRIAAYRKRLNGDRDVVSRLNKRYRRETWKMEIFKCEEVECNVNQTPPPSSIKWMSPNDPLPDSVRLHMASVIVPWLDARGKDVDYGVFCSGCLASEYKPRRLHTKLSIIGHLRRCCVKPASETDSRDPPLWLCD